MLKTSTSRKKLKVRDFWLDSKDSQLPMNQKLKHHFKAPGALQLHTMQYCSKNVLSVFPKHVIFNTQRWFRQK